MRSREALARRALTELRDELDHMPTCGEIGDRLGIQYHSACWHLHRMDSYGPLPSLVWRSRGGLTRAQARVFAAVRRLTGLSGRPPLATEIAADIGCKPQNVCTHVKNLIRQGALVREGNGRRNLRIKKDKR